MGEERCSSKTCRGCPACSRKFVVATSGPDPNRQFVGSSPFFGDFNNTGLIIPTAATLDQTNRYLFRLAALQVGPLDTATIFSIRQYLSLGADKTRTDYPTTFFEQQIETPMWCFADGNVSWHLLKVEPSNYTPVLDPTQQPGTSPNVIGLDSVLLYSDMGPPYVPPANGMPLGTPIGALGTWRDLRYPWKSQTNLNHLQLTVDGPCIVALYASVRQTDVASHFDPFASDPDECFPSLCLPPEDCFLLNFPGARYHRIAGELVAEVCPNGKGKNRKRCGDGKRRVNGVGVGMGAVKVNTQGKRKR